MGVIFYVPEFRQVSKSTKDVVMSILGVEGDLSLKEIFNRTKKNYGLNVTYQAVHKTLKSLVLDDIVIVDNFKYKINADWLERSIVYLESLQANLKKDEVLDSSSFSISSYLEFNSMKELDEFVTKIDTGNQKSILHVRHFWWAFFNLDKQSNESNSFKNIYALCKSDTLIDRWNAEYKNKVGIHALTGVDCANTNDLMVKNDYIISIYYDQRFIEEVDDLYLSKQNLKDSKFLSKLNKLFSKNYPIKVSVVKDRILAKQLRKNTLKFFQIKKFKSAKYKLVVFDLDGTLIQSDDYSWQLVWKYLGFSRNFRRSGMKRYLRKEITYHDWTSWALKNFKKKKMHRDVIKEVCQEIETSNNLYLTLDELKKSGIKLALVSGGIDTFIEETIPDYRNYFTDENIYINRFKYSKSGELEDIDITKYDFEHKLSAVREICKKEGVDLSQVVFVGDNINDVEVAKGVGLSIAFMPDSLELEHVSDVSIKENDLSKILDYILE